jgi:outer membrane protein assembly factor BamA
MQFIKLKFIIRFFFLFGLSTLFSCNITKNIENEQRLVKNIISFDKKNADFQKYEIEKIIKPKPNTKFFGIPIKLYINNLWTKEKKELWENKKKEKCSEKKKTKISRINKKIKPYENEIHSSDVDSKNYKKYQNKITAAQIKKEKKENKTCNKKHFGNRKGEKPVFFKLYDNDYFRNIRNIRVFLNNRGYYSPIVKISEKQRGKNKVVAIYEINQGKAHLINDIKFQIDDKRIEQKILSDQANTLLKAGNRLDVQTIEDERKRIADMLKDNGYFTFSKEYIYFSVDTVNKNFKADITINVSNQKNDTTEGAEFKRHFIDNVYIYPNYKPNDAILNKEEYYKYQDTIIYYSKNDKKYFLIYKEVPKINPNALTKGIYVASDEFYNLKRIKASYKYLASLPIIQTAMINFHNSKHQANFNDSVKYLDCEIKLTQDKLQAYELTSEITHTSGNWGMAGSLIYTHNNFFRNTEVLNLKLNGELKRLTKNSDYEIPIPTGLFNSFKYGVDLNIQFPRMLVPVPLKNFIRRSNPKTNINTTFNYSDRPDIKWSVAGGAIGYTWSQTQTILHSFMPITADFLKVYRKFDDYKLDETYENRFVFGSSYRFSFNNQLYRKKLNYFYITSYIKVAGNSLNLFMNWLNKPKTDNSYILFGNAFAQFIKTDFDIRYYRKLNRAKDNLVFRIFAGGAIPYGNLSVIPFSERYFSGGSNGIRAWEERSLGPGSYSAENNENIPYFNERADLKLEGNIEYRMKLFWRFEGALFIDAGNIWAINKNDVRIGASFESNDFYKEIAIGSGLGIRLDFDFFLVRLDLGFKIKDPSLPENERWIPFNIIPTLNNAKFNLGIGYPF